MDEFLTKLFSKYQDFPSFLDCSPITSVHDLGTMGETLLNLAVNSQSKEDVILLIKNGANVNKQGELNFTPIQNACIHGNLDIIEMIMNNHIEDLRKKLNEHNWEVSEELEGNELDISGYWVINQLYEPNKSLTLGFEGMDDLKVLPMEKSYACFLSEKPSVSLYFSKNNPKMWKKNLEEFVLNLNSVIFDKI